MNNIKKRDLALITDFYELLMMQGYFEDFEKGKRCATFDVFYRRTPFDNGFAVFCGLNEIIDYIENLKFTEDDIKYLKSLNSFNDEFLKFLKDFKWNGSLYAFHEGSVIGEREPIIKVKASLIECQLIESAMLSLFNHETLVATKAYRICEAARPYKVMEFGLRRAMSFDAGIYGAKAACIAGCIGTSNVLTAKDFDVPALGTMAHSWVMTFEDELTAFKSFADLYPDNCILLVDTYNTLTSGVPNAIKTFEYMKSKGINSKKYGIRLDSGDLAYLSKEARIMLDEAGFKDAIICASNDLDEEVIQALKIQNAEITLYGIGTKLITGAGSTLGGVYKLSSVYDEKDKKYIPKIKISSNSEKITNPGDKEVYRIYNVEDNKFIADLIALSDEVYDEAFTQNNDLLIKDEFDDWKKKLLKKGTYKMVKMLNKVFENGKLVYNRRSVKESADYFNKELATLSEDNKRLVYPKKLYVDISDKLYNIKYKILEEHYK